MSEINLLYVTAYASPTGLAFGVNEMAARETERCMFFDGNRYSKKDILVPKKDDVCARFPYHRHVGKRHGCIIFNTICKPEQLAEAKTVLTNSMIGYVRIAEEDVRNTLDGILSSMAGDTDTENTRRWRTRQEAEAKFQYEINED